MHKNRRVTLALVGNIASMLINFRKELVLDLLEQGYEVYCFAYGYSENEREIVKSWGAIPCDHYLNLKGMNPISDLKGVVHLYKEFKRIKPDIVFNTFIKPVIFSTIAAKLAKVPKVVGMIEGLGNAFTPYPEGISQKAIILRFIQIILYKCTLPLLDNLLVLNMDDKRDLVDKYRIRVKNILILGGIGVDLQKFEYVEPKNNDIAFIFIARLLREKGILEFLRSANLIKKQHPNVKFLVLGGFDENNPFALSKTSLQEYVDSCTIEYLGYVDNVPDIIAECSVFVLPSFYREGVPRSTQEAMAVGRAIITTDVPGCRETVENGVNGFLVAPYSSEAVAEKMEYFIQNPDEIRRMGRESRRIAEEKFDIYKVNKKIISILEN